MALTRTAGVPPAAGCAEDQDEDEHFNSAGMAFNDGGRDARGPSINKSVPLHVIGIPDRYGL